MPPNNNASLNMRLPSELLAQLRMAAAISGRTAGQEVRIALAIHCGRVLIARIDDRGAEEIPDDDERAEFRAAHVRNLRDIEAVAFGTPTLRALANAAPDGHLN